MDPSYMLTAVGLFILRVIGPSNLSCRNGWLYTHDPDAGLTR
jgi:hypothetical protein